jgi:DNA repair exonuclease SbcCD nuclease subunit
MAHIAIICDSHFGVRNDSPVFLEYFKKSLVWFFTQLEQNGITKVLHLGDLFDRRKYLNYVTAKTCREFFLEECERRSIETHIITGNHDVYYKDTHKVNALREIVGGRYQFIHIYDEPVLLNLDGTSIQLIPWICDSNKDTSYDAIKNTSADILIGHFDIKGFELHSGNVSNHGDDVSMFSRFDLVFSGHYHHKSSQGNIHYLGAFAEYTWSDYNDPRGFTIFDTSTRDFHLVQNPHKIFKMLSYNDVKDLDIMGKINTMDFSEYKDTYVKILCLKKENPYAFDMMLDKLYKASPVDITVLEEEFALTSNDDDIDIDEVQDTPRILENYISSLTLPINNDKMVDYMRNIYSDAISTKFI